MDFLYFLEGIRTDWLNAIMQTVTHMGDELVFLVCAIVMFWCFDKRKGYYLLAVGFAGTLLNQFCKLLFRVPRPWVLDENFTIVEQARERATGYSFPSGHTQSSVGTFGAIAAITRKRTVCAICLLIAILVPFSRMYLGVHTPKDILVAAATAVILIMLFRPIALSKNEKIIPIVFAVLAVLSVLFALYVELFPFPSNIDIHNLESGVKNAYTLLGAIIGILVVYIVDNMWLHFPTKAVWWAQILKTALGLGAVLVVKSGLKGPINLLFGASIGTAVRYFLMVIVAGILWPLTFRWFAGLGKRE